MAMTMGLWLWLWGYSSGYGKDLQTWRGPSPKSGVMNLAKRLAWGVESLAKDGAEVGIGDNDGAEVESFGDGSLTEDRVGAKSLADYGAEIPSVDEYAAEIERLAEDRLGVKSLTEEGARVRNLIKDMPGVSGLGEAGIGSLAKDVSENSSLGEASAKVRVLGESVDRLNPSLNLGLLLSDSQELLEVSLIDKIKLKVFIMTMYTALPAFPYFSASI